MLYIGIDPGEAWCGFAALDITSEGLVRVEARTYSIKSHRGYLGMAHDVVDLLPHNKPAHIAIEDFRIRKAGHQSFNAGNTLRMIGALEFGLSSVSLFSHSFYPPNDKGLAETSQLFGRIFKNYHRQWARHRHPAWGHCISAWRVLGHHLMKHEQELLLQLHKKKRSHAHTQWLPAAKATNDHIAPAAWWLK